MPQTENTTTTPATGNTANTTVTAFDRAAFIQEYNTTGSPKQRKIPCTVTGEMVTIFGVNLKKRVEKFGSVEALLDGFVSRKATGNINKEAKAAKK
jgi:hypothetical protein